MRSYDVFESVKVGRLCYTRDPTQSDLRISSLHPTSTENPKNDTWETFFRARALLLDGEKEITGVRGIGKREG